MVTDGIHLTAVRASLQTVCFVHIFQSFLKFLAKVCNTALEVVDVFDEFTATLIVHIPCILSDYKIVGINTDIYVVYPLFLVFSERPLHRLTAISVTVVLNTLVAHIPDYEVP